MNPDDDRTPIIPNDATDSDCRTRLARCIPGMRDNRVAPEPNEEEFVNLREIPAIPEDGPMQQLRNVAQELVSGVSRGVSNLLNDRDRSPREALRGSRPPRPASRSTSRGASRSSSRGASRSTSHEQICGAQESTRGGGSGTRGQGSSSAQKKPAIRSLSDKIMANFRKSVSPPASVPGPSTRGKSPIPRYVGEMQMLGGQFYYFIERNPEATGDWTLVKFRFLTTRLLQLCLPLGNGKFDVKSVDLDEYDVGQGFMGEMIQDLAIWKPVNLAPPGGKMEMLLTFKISKHCDYSQALWIQFQTGRKFYEFLDFWTDYVCGQNSEFAERLLQDKYVRLKPILMRFDIDKQA